MISMLLRFSRRQLHTIVSREIIKPSSPTPSHNRTHNLSLFDQTATNSHIPVVAFYLNVDQSSFDKTIELKKSLSKTLAQYYMYAGRVKKSDPTYVDCNDEGVEYIEASIDSSLSDFLQRSMHEDFDQLFPNDLLWFDPHIRGDTEGVTCPLAVQVNHFACGGIAVASTLFHKVGDGRTALNFITHWATVNAKKDTSLVNPHIICYRQTRNSNLPDLISEYRSRVGCVTRSFLFPNQKLNNLKAKVIAMTMESGQPIMNPTQVEVLTWLLHNCTMAAVTKKKAGTFKASGMGLPMDMRDRLKGNLPGTSIGNLFWLIELPTTSQNELAPDFFINEIRKRKASVQSLPNLEAAMEIVAQMPPEIARETSKRLDEYYLYSSSCKLPVYNIDFGWGKPVKVTIGGTMKNLTMLMAAPDGNGIEAIMCLEKEHMKILQNDPELLAFC